MESEIGHSKGCHNPGLYVKSHYWERYITPIYITENGMTKVDWVALDGKVHDPQHLDYFRRYLSELQRAIQDGVVHVDFSTQKRLPQR